MLAFVLLSLCLCLRCNVPRWHFTQLLDGSEQYRITRIEFMGNGRTVECTDEKTLAYWDVLLRRSAASTLRHKGDSPTESIHSFYITFYLNTGFEYKVPAYITKTQIDLVGQTEWQIEPRSPFRTLLFEDAPPSFKELMDKILTEPDWKRDLKSTQSDSKS